jgi:hypothetical protein
LKGNIDVKNIVLGFMAAFSFQTFIFAQNQATADEDKTESVAPQETQSIVAPATQSAVIETETPSYLAGHVSVFGAFGLGGGKAKRPSEKKDVASARFGARYFLEDVREQNSSFVFGASYGSHTSVNINFDTNHAIQQFILNGGFWMRPIEEEEAFSVQLLGGLGMWRKTGRYQDQIKSTRSDSGPMLEIETAAFLEIIPKVEILGGLAANLSRESWYQAMIGLQGRF